MMTLQHKGLMFGHQDDLAYGTKWYGEEDFLKFYNDPKTLFQKDVRMVSFCPVSSAFTNNGL